MVTKQEIEDILSKYNIKYNFIERVDCWDYISQQDVCMVVEELPYMARMHNFCAENPDINILYIEFDETKSGLIKIEAGSEQFEVLKTIYDIKIFESIIKNLKTICKVREETQDFVDSQREKIDQLTNGLIFMYIY